MRLDRDPRYAAYCRSVGVHPTMPAAPDAARFTIWLDERLARFRQLYPDALSHGEQVDGDRFNNWLLTNEGSTA